MAMWEKLKGVAAKAKREVRVWRAVMGDSRTPRLAKVLLWIAIAYLVSPIEIIPDFIPLVGYLDDVLIVSALILIAMQLIPREVMEEAREASERP